MNCCHGRVAQWVERPLKGPASFGATLLTDVGSIPGRGVGVRNICRKILVTPSVMILKNQL